MRRLERGIAVGLCTVWFVSVVLCPRAVAATTDDLVFMHHSCGANWLGNSLDAALVAKDYVDERNDMYYGVDINPDTGRPDSLSPIPGDSTNMNHWVPWLNDYLAHVKTQGCANGVNRIIMFKSCYPISDVSSDGTEPGDPFSSTQSLVNYKAVYRHPSGPGGTYPSGGYLYSPLEDVFTANPDTLFIPVTAPPLCNTATTDANAHRARLFNNWLKNDWLTSYETAHPEVNNVAVFDWFDLLANPDDAASYPNRLKAAYGGSTTDSHPNAAANAFSTQVFATNLKNFIDEAWFRFTRTPGDCAGDNAIDGADLAAWQQNFDPLGMNGDTNRWELGDWNQDGRLDPSDLTLWQQNHDPTDPTGGVGGVVGLLTEVPEPTTSCLIVVGLGGLVLSGKKRRRA